jgi:hypothetical protein
MGSSLKAVCVTRNEMSTAVEPDVIGTIDETTREIKAV